MKGILDALAAFHQNGWNYLLYTIMNNWWFLLLAVGAIVSIVLYVHEEMSVTVHDEQQAL